MDSSKKLLIMGIAAITMSVTSSGAADARTYGLGMSAPPPYIYGARSGYGSFYYGGTYGYPYYGYYGGGFIGCYKRSRTVSFTRSGRAVKKRVRVCY